MQRQLFPFWHNYLCLETFEMFLWKVCKTYKKSKHSKWQIFWILEKESTSQCLNRGFESKSQKIRDDRIKHFRIQCRMNCSTYLISEVNNLIISLIILWVKNWLNRQFIGWQATNLTVIIESFRVFRIYSQLLMGTGT